MPCMFDQRRSRDRVKPHPLRKPVQERQPSMVVRVDLLQGNNIGIKLVQDIDDPIRMYCPSIPTQL